jgi:hypothetical protein
MPSLKKPATKKIAKKKVLKKAAAKKVTPKKTIRKATTKKVTPKKTAAKKVVKKVVAKKGAKKTTSKKQAKKSLVLAPNEKSFWVTNGEVLNSLLALRDALDEMEKEVYSYHVSKEHSDFASWVDSVLCDKKCAAELKKAKTPDKAKTVVVRHLKVYSV